VNDNTPQISRMQIDLLVNSFVNDMARVATLQYTKSVGQARMKWLDITDNHHGLSHEPDKDEVTQAKLVKINKWFCGEISYLVEKLAGTPEPGGLLWWPTLEILKAVFKAKNVLGADITELAPIKGQPASDYTIAKLVYKMIGYKFF